MDSRKSNHYHPSMWVGNVSVMSVCLSVCLSVHLSVFLSVQAITFEPLDIETLFFVCRYILTISRSAWSIKVIRLRSRSYERNDNFTYFNMSIFAIWLQVINKVKVAHQGEGHINIKVKYPFKSRKILCSLYFPQAENECLRN